MDWDQAGSDFLPDGALRDIYVLNVTIDDWQAVVDIVRDLDPPPVYMVDIKPVPLPERVEDIFAVRPNASPMLSFMRANAQLNCHFFSQDEIEFDLDPAEVAEAEDLFAVAEFMETIGWRTGKTVILTQENTRKNPILRFTTDSGEVEWLPPGRV